jgi:SRSO17 transposase
MSEIKDWSFALDALFEHVRADFPAEGTYHRAQAYVQGLLSPAERKNSWQLAEMLGEPTPYALQQFLYRAHWDAEAVREDLRTYVVEHLGAENAVLCLDETGFLKKGDRSAGVQRQYSGTAGRIENCQVGVFLLYASEKGSAFLDRALYLPESWTRDRERCRRAGISDAVLFAPKPQLAKAMLERAANAHVPFRWVTADSVYGDDRSLRLWLEEQGHAYVLAVTGKEYVPVPFRQRRISTLLEELPKTGWRRLSAGNGSKGPRGYEWQAQRLMPPLQEGFARLLLVRRSLSDPDEKTAFVCYAPLGTPLSTLIEVAGSRWSIEKAFEEAKGDVGLDQYEVRSVQGWYRHITLACLAHAFLVVARAQGSPPRGPKKGGLVRRQQSSLAAFKTQRGLLSV